MHAIRAFFLGLAFTGALAFAIVWYLQIHLRALLVELCGNAVRADFWMAFTNIALILVPLFFAMECRPEGGEGVAVFFQIVDQLKWAVFGVIGSILVLAAILGSFIRSAVPQVPR